MPVQREIYGVLDGRYVNIAGDTMIGQLTVPAFRNTGHSGLGATGNIWVNAVINAEEENTDIVGFFYGQRTYLNINPTADTGCTYLGLYCNAASVLGNIRNFTQYIYGAYLQGTHNGSGNLPYLFGADIRAWNNQAGSITTRALGSSGTVLNEIGNIVEAVGVRGRAYQSSPGGVMQIGAGLKGQIDCANGNINTAYCIWAPNPATAGPIGTLISLYIEQPTKGAVNWSIYSAGGDNYFAGKFGIGTTALNAKMNIKQENEGAGSGLRLIKSSSANYWGLAYDGSDGLTFVRDGIDKTWFDRAGNTVFKNVKVGIGRDVPGAPLHISHAVQGASAFILQNFSDSSTWRGEFFDFQEGSQDTVVATWGHQNTFVFGDGTAQTFIAARVPGEPLTFMVGGYDKEKMRITSTGKIGINRTDPARMLEIVDASDPQIRLTHTIGAQYADFQCTGASQLEITLAGNLALTLSQPGLLSVDATGVGAPAQVDLFDEYDDAHEIEGLVKNRNLEFMQSLGIVSPKQGGGYFWNLQPVLRLIMCAIYQLQHRMNSLDTDVDMLKRSLDNAKSNYSR